MTANAYVKTNQYLRYLSLSAVIIIIIIVICVGRNSSVSIATRYGLDGPGIESRCGQDFPHLSRPALGPTQPPYTMGTGSLPGVKRPGRDVEHPPTSSAEVIKKE